jgi:hypothetical protein
MATSRHQSQLEPGFFWEDAPTGGLTRRDWGTVIDKPERAVAATPTDPPAAEVWPAGGLFTHEQTLNEDHKITTDHGNQSECCPTVIEAQQTNSGKNKN